MKAFILAAGLGTRLRPLTLELPKPLVPVLNVPTICYTLMLLREAGINEVVCNLHYHSGQIRKLLEEHDYFGMDITLSEEEEILGTGGGLKKCERLLADEEFILINSDIIADFNLNALIKQHQEKQNGGTLMLFQHPEAASIGEAGIQEDQIIDFANRRATGTGSGCIYTGAAILSPTIFRYLSTAQSSIVDTGFYGLIDNSGLDYILHPGFWHDIGTLHSLWALNIEHADTLETLAERMRKALGIEPKAIAEDAAIGMGAEVANSVIGKHCRVGRNANLQATLLMPGVTVPEGAMLEHCIAWKEGSIPVSMKKKHAHERC